MRHLRTLLLLTAALSPAGSVLASPHALGRLHEPRRVRLEVVHVTGARQAPQVVYLIPRSPAVDELLGEREVRVMPREVQPMLP